MKTKLFLLLLLLLPVVQAQVAVQSFTTSPPSVFPGEATVLTLEIENVGSKRVNNIFAALDLTQLPLATIGSSTEKVLERIRADDSEIITFQIQVLPTAEPRLYKIPVTLTYEGVSKTSLLSMEVSALPQIEVIIDSATIVKVGDQGKVNFKFVNKGLIPIRSLTTTVRESENYEILSSRSVYIGEVDVGDFETEEFVLIAKNKNPLITMDLLYRDTNNQEYSTMKLIPLKVYTQEEAKQLGLVADNSTRWIVVIIVLTALLGFFIIRRIRKKRKNDN